MGNVLSRILILLILCQHPEDAISQSKSRYYLNTKIKFGNDFSGFIREANYFIYGVGLNFDAGSQINSINIYRGWDFDGMESTTEIRFQRNFQGHKYYYFAFNWFADSANILKNHLQNVEFQNDTLIFIYDLKTNDTFIEKSSFYRVFRQKDNRCSSPVSRIIGFYYHAMDTIQINRNCLIYNDSIYKNIELRDTTANDSGIKLLYTFNLSERHFLVYRDKTDNWQVMQIAPTKEKFLRKPND